MNLLFRVLVIALVAAVVIASGAAAAGCGAEMNAQSVRGSGVVASEPRAAAGFTDVRLAGAGDAVVEQSGTESVTVEAEDNLLPLLETTVENGVLRLGVKDGVGVHTTRPIRYRVSARTLNAVSVSGSGRVHATGIDAERFSASISGSGTAEVAGRADDVRLTVSGSGDFRAADLKARTLRVNISGSGNATVNVSDRLEANVSGSGSVQYLGNPRIDQRVSGSGTVTQR